MNLRICILVEAHHPRSWVYTIINQLDQHPLIELVFFGVDQKIKSGGSPSNTFYRLLRKLDRLIFRFNPDAFLLSHQHIERYGKPIYSISPIQSKFSDSFTHEDIEKIRACKPDLILRFGFRIIKGEILDVAKYGIWSLHHGDNAVNRGGPPAFWEVVHQEAVTGVTLQRLTDQLDGGVVIDKAFVRTDTTSFNRNANKIFWAGVELMLDNLSYLAKNGEPRQCSGSLTTIAPYHCPLYRDPANTQALKIELQFIRRRFFDWVSNLLSPKQWHLAYIQTKAHTDNPPLYRYKSLQPPANTDWADPFLVTHEGQVYCFFEEMKHADGKGHISCFCLTAVDAVTTKQVVLQEPHHLSYPFIFPYESELYMIPEAAACGQVWLYRCSHFPNEWKKDTLLLEGSLYDPNVYFHEGIWYLFGTQKPLPGSSPDQYLYIYWSHDVRGPWQPHATNPQTRDVRKARPAGRIYRDGGKLIRPSQIGAPVYGYGIQFNEIVQLTPEEFIERPIGEILPKWKQGLKATHTFNREGRFIVVDAQG